MARIPENHPRYESLSQRERLIEGIKKGYVAEAGLIAHGRGEAFDYLLGERTIELAEKAERVAVALLLLSENPVISVNGNTAALVPKEIVKLANLLNAKIEVNLFYRTLKREKLIARILKKNGAKEIFGIGRDSSKKIPGLDSRRGRVDPEGIWKSDTVLIPLEDGDRTESLVRMKKNVIAIDLNPLSRTSQNSTVTIVDNLVRAIPSMVKFANGMKHYDEKKLKKLVEKFDNKKNLKRTIGIIRSNSCREQASPPR